jgi:hypothetical protein
LGQKLGRGEIKTVFKLRVENVAAGDVLFVETRPLDYSGLPAPNAGPEDDAVIITMVQVLQ